MLQVIFLEPRPGRLAGGADLVDKAGNLEEMKRRFALVRITQYVDLDFRAMCCRGSM